jgi:hypothetical protein
MVFQVSTFDQEVLNAFEQRLDQGVSAVVLLRMRVSPVLGCVAEIHGDVLYRFREIITRLQAFFIAPSNQKHNLILGRIAAVVDHEMGLYSIKDSDRLVQLHEQIKSIQGKP